MYALGGILGRAIVGAGDDAFTRPISWKTDAARAFAWIAALVWLYVLVRRTIGNGAWRRAFSWPSLGDVGWIALGFVAMNVLSYLAGTIQLRLFHVSPHNWAARLVVVSGFGPATITFCMLGTILTPLVEEIAHRGLLFTTLVTRFGFMPAAIASSFVFATLHRDAAAIVPIFLSGLVLAMLYAKTKSLTVPYVLHGLYNGGLFTWTMLVLHARAS
jgi:membrane protease YdiL (CAAX protease family)